jgi:hypothetical protein
MSSLGLNLSSNADVSTLPSLAFDNGTVHLPKAWHVLPMLELPTLAPNGRKLRFLELADHFIEPVLLIPQDAENDQDLNCKILPPYNTLEAFFLIQGLDNELMPFILPLTVAKNLADCGWIKGWQYIDSHLVRASITEGGLENLFPTAFETESHDLSNKWPLMPWSYLNHYYLGALDKHVETNCVLDEQLASIQLAEDVKELVSVLPKEGLH